MNRDPLQSLQILHFISKLLLLFCNIEYFYLVAYLVEFGDITCNISSEKDCYFDRALVPL